MSRPRAKNHFRTEEELCTAFIEDMKGQGWIIYPETAGFDLLLMRKDTGHQLGIEAKLHLNAKVIEQILPTTYAPDIGPDWRGILVPDVGISYGLRELLSVLGVMVFAPREDFRYRQGSYSTCFRFEPLVPDKDHWEFAWHDWNPKKRCELPEIVPSVAAGVPCPIQLTTWKIGALKVIARLELQGSVTRDEVRACRVDPRRFCAADGWLEPAGERGHWKRGPRLPRFEEQHPAEYVQVRAAVKELLSTRAQA